MLPSQTQADLTKNRLVRAGKLTSALADEGVRWQQTADTIQQQTDLLVGDVFLGSACIAYYGAFTGAYRCEARGKCGSCPILGLPQCQREVVGVMAGEGKHIIMHLPRREPQEPACPGMDQCLQGAGDPSSIRQLIEGNLGQPC